MKPDPARAPVPPASLVTLTRAAFSAQAFMKSAGGYKDSASDSAARKIARRLINSRQSERAEGRTPARVAAAASEQLYRELSRWVGADGCHALFTRALAQARLEHPALAQVQLHARSEPYIDGVAESIIAHGDPATAEALESMLVRLVELLGRLIGDDMASKVIEQSLTAPERGGGSSGNRREEA